jgi:hypothetical protein
MPKYRNSLNHDKLGYDPRMTGRGFLSLLGVDTPPKENKEVEASIEEWIQNKIDSLKQKLPSSNEETIKSCSTLLRQLREEFSENRRLRNDQKEKQSLMSRAMNNSIKDHHETLYD